jgi:hypothetical protein
MILESIALGCITLWLIILSFSKTNNTDVVGQVRQANNEYRSYCDELIASLDAEAYGKSAAEKVEAYLCEAYGDRWTGLGTNMDRVDERLLLRFSNDLAKMVHKEVATESFLDGVVLRLKNKQVK